MFLTLPFGVVSYSRFHSCKPSRPAAGFGVSHLARLPPIPMAWMTPGGSCWPSIQKTNHTPGVMCVVAFLCAGQEAQGLTVGLGLVPPAFGAVIASRGHAGELAGADQQRSASAWWRNGWWTG